MNSYSQDIEDELLSKLRKLAKRDKALYTAVQKIIGRMGIKGRIGMIYHTSEWFFGGVMDFVFNIGKTGLVWTRRR